MSRVRLFAFGGNSTGQANAKVQRDKSIRHIGGFLVLYFNMVPVRETDLAQSDVRKEFPSPDGNHRFVIESSGDASRQTIRYQAKNKLGGWGGIMTFDKDENYQGSYFSTCTLIIPAVLSDSSGHTTIYCNYGDNGLLDITPNVSYGGLDVVADRNAHIASGHFTLRQLKKHFKNIDFTETVKLFLQQVQDQDFRQPTLVPQEKKSRFWKRLLHTTSQNPQNSPTQLPDGVVKD